MQSVAILKIFLNFVPDRELVNAQYWVFTEFYPAKLLPLPGFSIFAIYCEV
jgi:hypothetical protein